MLFAGPSLRRMETSDSASQPRVGSEQDKARQDKASLLHEKEEGFMNHDVLCSVGCGVTAVGRVEGWLICW